MTGARAGRAGFTLPEAIVALVISSVLVLLVGTVFLVQNDFYSHVMVRSQVQENARAMKEIVGGEVRAMTAGGVILADSTRLVLRSNMVMAVVCSKIGSDIIAHIPGGLSSVDTAEVAGFGYRNPATGAWSYYDRTWSQLLRTGGTPTQLCYANGADTVGISSQFIRLKNIDNDTGISATNLFGSVIMLFRETEFRFNTSTLVPGDRALYWGIYGQTLNELVTGVSTGARFEFRTGTNTWSKVITGGTLATVNGVRIVARSVGKGQTSRELTYDFDLTLDVPLANAY